ncbi:hypothetical protein [Corynebacterium sp.]|uniref:hypothetical protein n=1 Tax=Corynebacterium sp. TaxID=1720 RepID=UPI002A91C2AE|nr:hypothetical protein [Corynebacterium sp.]MDY5784712.1 hypothetical protein [Corynebacterium sp.]
MSDSFAQFRPDRATERRWVAGGLAVLAVALLGALAAAVYALSRPANERTPLPSVVTVTAQPGPTAESASPTPGTYTGWLFSSGDTAEAGWNAALTLAPDSAMITYLNNGCTALLTLSDGQRWTATPLSASCGPTDGSWTITQPEPGVLDVEYTSSTAPRVHGSLSREVRVD